MRLLGNGRLGCRSSRCLDGTLWLRFLHLRRSGSLFGGPLLVLRIDLRLQHHGLRGLLGGLRGEAALLVFQVGSCALTGCTQFVEAGFLLLGLRCGGLCGGGLLIGVVLALLDSLLDCLEPVGAVHRSVEVDGGIGCRIRLVTGESVTRLHRLDEVLRVLRAGHDAHDIGGV